MGSRQKRSKIANLLFAGGGITAAALLTQYQLSKAPQEVVFHSADGLTEEVGRALELQVPELPTCEVVENPHPYEPVTAGLVAPPRPVEEAPKKPEVYPGQMVLPPGKQ